MTFKIIPHNPKLNKIVKSMWYIEDSVNNRHAYEFKEYITFACAYPNVVFQLKGEGFLLTSMKEKSKFIPRYHFTGLIKKPIDIATHRPFTLFGISFYPHVFHSLFNFDPKLTINNVLDFKTVIKTDHTNFTNINPLHTTVEEIQSIFTNYLLELQSKTNKTLSLFEASLSYILSNNGNASIKDLGDHLGYSTRQIERVFKTHVGMSPKEYSSILRFQHTIHLNALNKNDNLTQLATFYGYTDQSHFIREFKKFSSLKPKDYYFKNDNIGVGFVKYQP